MGVLSIVIYVSVYLALVSAVFYILTYIEDSRKKKLLYSDKELPLVSVIIPCYNKGKEAVKKTIDSVLKSDYPDLEIILVDDGSTDDTWGVLKEFASKYKNVSAFHKENGGKATALNLGLTKVKGEIIFSVDADTMAHPKSIKRMVRYFKDPEIMCVGPAVVVDKPKSILQRIQHIEYFAGVFLRKALAGLNALYITPGAFSAYRKTFFDKYGGWRPAYNTEDLEMSMRILYNGYKIENCPDAPAYTIPPSGFKSLYKQRRRWYFGLIKNLSHYRKMFSRKYGDLGVFVLPTLALSIFVSIFVTAYFVFKTIFDIKREILFMQSVNFDFSSSININYYTIERFAFLFFSKPTVIFLILFMFLMGFYLFYATKKVGKSSSFIINLPLFLIFFALLFGFWWIVSIVYALFTDKIEW